MRSRPRRTPWTSPAPARTRRATECKAGPSGGRARQLVAVGLQAVGELLRAGEGGEVAAVHLVRRDAEPLPRDPAHELRGEEAVVAAQQEAGRHGRPGAERPRLLEGRIGLSARSASERFRHDVLGDVVEEGREGVEGAVRRSAVALVLLASGRRVTGVRPPVARRFARRRDHRRQHHEQVDGEPLAHEGRREAGKGLGNQHEVAALADRVDHRVGVLREPGRVVVARQVRRDHVVAARTQLGHQPMPVPGVGSGPVNQCVGRHLGCALWPSCSVARSVVAPGGLP